MDKQNLPCNFLDLNQEFIKHFRMAVFVIKIKGIHFIISVGFYSSVMSGHKRNDKA